VLLEVLSCNAAVRCDGEGTGSFADAVAPLGTLTLMPRRNADLRKELDAAKREDAPGVGTYLSWRAVVQLMPLGLMEATAQLRKGARR
jgi:hypothetical protein